MSEDPAAHSLGVAPNHPNSATYATDDELVDARDHWDSPQWDAHFHAVGRLPAGGARYDPAGGNDVLRLALLRVQKGRCWLQGSADCRSRSLLLREAEIDHIVPKTAGAAELRTAIEQSSYQQRFFDVHDPGNLAIACHPCNNEKRTWLPPMHVKRAGDIASQRAQVIRAWHAWHNRAAVDEAALKALQGVGLEDAVVREMYAEIAATMIANLAQQAGQPGSLTDWQVVTVETDLYAFEVGPSHAACEAYIEMRAEMEADDRRHGV